MGVAAVNLTEAELLTVISIVEVYQYNLFCDISGYVEYFIKDSIRMVKILDVYKWDTCLTTWIILILKCEYKLKS